MGITIVLTGSAYLLSAGAEVAVNIEEQQICVSAAAGVGVGIAVGIE